MDSEHQAVINAVRDYAIRRHEDLSISNIVGFSDDELEEMKTEEGSGKLVYTIENVEIKETEQVEGAEPTYYVAATIYFYKTSGEAVEGSTDIYECYKCEDHFTHKKDTWCIQWYAE